MQEPRNGLQHFDAMPQFVDICRRYVALRHKPDSPAQTATIAAMAGESYDGVQHRGR